MSKALHIVRFLDHLPSLITRLGAQVFGNDIDGGNPEQEPLGPAGFHRKCQKGRERAKGGLALCGFRHPRLDQSHFCHCISCNHSSDPFWVRTAANGCRLGPGAHLLWSPNGPQLGWWSRSDQRKCGTG